MKHLLSVGLCVLLGLSAGAEPVKAMLVVQNHASEEFRKPLSNLGTRLSTALSGDGILARTRTVEYGARRCRSLPPLGLPSILARRL